MSAGISRRSMPSFKKLVKVNKRTASKKSPTCLNTVDQSLTVKLRTDMLMLLSLPDTGPAQFILRQSI